MSFQMLSVYLIALTGPSLASASLSSRAICSNFSVEGQTYTIPGQSPSIISAGVVCSGTQPCDVISRGFVTANRTLSISTSEEVSDDIFSLISSVVDIDFATSITGNITSSTWEITNGTSGYLIFTPNFRCVKGALEGCTSAGLENGTVIEACAPLNGVPYAPIDGQIGGISGTIGVVSTDETTARAITCNPADTLSPKDAPNATCRSTASTVPSSLAVRSITSWRELILISLLSVVGFAMELF